VKLLYNLIATGDGVAEQVSGFVFARISLGLDIDHRARLGQEQELGQRAFGRIWSIGTRAAGP
jgi:hypothetical protein